MRVLIGIQARSGSTRLHRKAFELIAGKTMLDRVIEQCKRAASYLNKTSASTRVDVAVLVPYKDPILGTFGDRCAFIEGPEQDVLERYRLAAANFDADLIVRITGDCPLIPPTIISKSVKIAIANKYDYVSNVDPRFRTYLDGADCEVISAALLRHTADEAIDALDREHVTTWIRRNPPEWARVGAVMGAFDHSEVKLSVDTEDDLARVRLACETFENKHRSAVHSYGQKAVHIV